MFKNLLKVLVITLLSGSLYAQVSISGTVTDAQTGEILPGVNILITELSRGAATDVDGNYTVNNVPAGTYTVRATFVGYKTYTATLQVDNQNVDFDIALESDLIDLDDVIVTAFGIQREQRALGYGVSNVNPEVIENKKELDIARSLSGTLPGVNIQSSGGLAGSGTDIVIRGFTSLSGDNSPLWIVDGVIFDGGSNSEGVSTAFNGGGNANSPNRFIDLDPNNVADVTVLKGLSASVLYGEKGKNGVIIITTKSGNLGNGIASSKEGQFEITLNQSYNIVQISSRPDYQNSYGGGFDQKFGWFFSNWGPRFSTDDAGLFGSEFIGFDLGPLENQCPSGFTVDECFVRRVDGEERRVVTRCPDGTDCSGRILIEHPLHQNPAGKLGFPEFHPDLAAYRYEAKQDNLEAFFQDGNSINTSFNVSGGWKDVNLNFNYSKSGEEGFTPNNIFEKDAVSIGVNYRISDRLSAQSTFNLSLTDTQAPPVGAGRGSGPSGSVSTSVFGDVFYTPRSIDLNMPYQNPLTNENAYYRANNGIPHPRWTAENVLITNNTDRYFGKAELNYNLLDNLNFVYRIGYDSYTENREYSQNPGGQRPSIFQDGFLQSITTQKTILDHNVNVLFDYQINQDITFNGLFGSQYLLEDFKRQGVESLDMIVFDFFEHGNFISQSSRNSFTGNDLQRMEERETLGVFADATLGYQDFVYLNFAARNDWFSTLESENRNIFYPSANLSYILSDHLDIQSDAITYVKLFGGIGSSAGQPSLYSTRSTLGSTGRGFVVPGSGEVISFNNTSNRLGNPNLKPELHVEYELGTDARFFNDRMGIYVQAYSRKTSDLITEAPLDPATGYTSSFINIGEIVNKGLELSLNGTPLRKTNLLWDITANFFTNTSEVTELGAGLDQVQVGDGFSNRGNFAQVGQPFGVMLGSKIERVTAELKKKDPKFSEAQIGAPLISSRGYYLRAEDIGKIGNPAPDWNLSLINLVNYKGFSFSSQIDYQQGGDMLSYWIGTLMGRGLSTDTDKVDRNNSFILPGVSQSTGKTNTLQISPSGVFFSNILYGPDENLVYDMTHIRLANLSLSYDLPVRVLGKTPFKQVTFTASGDNLWLYMFNVPKASGFDPNVNSIGGNSRGFEYLTGPAARRFGFNVNLKF